MGWIRLIKGSPDHEYLELPVGSKPPKNAGWEFLFENSKIIGYYLTEERQQTYDQDVGRIRSTSIEIDRKPVTEKTWLYKRRKQK